MNPDVSVSAPRVTTFDKNEFSAGNQYVSTNLPIAEAIASGKKILLVCLTSGLLLGTFLTVIQKPVYESHLSLEFHDMSTELASLSPDSRNAISGNISLDKYIETKAELLRSRSLIAAVIDKLPEEKIETKSSNVLVDLVKRQKQRLQYWLMTKGLPWFQPIDPREEAIDSASNSLTVTTSPTTRVVELTYSAQTPQNAALFLNALAEQFISENVSSRWKATKQTANWLTQQSVEFRSELQQLEQQLEKASKSTSLIGTSEKQDNVAEERLRQLQTELSAAQNDRIRRQTTYEATKSGNLDTLPEILSDKELAEYTARKTTLQQQYADLSAVFTKDNPKITRLTAQLTELEEIIKQHKNNIVQRIDNDYTAALRREELLSTEFKQQKSFVSGHASEKAYYNLLKNEVDTKRHIYNDMLHRVQDAGVVSAIRANNIQIIDSASVPSRPSRPRPILNIAGCAFVGLLGSSLWIYAKERMNQNIRYPGDVSTFLGLAELGVIPATPSQEDISTKSNKLILSTLSYHQRLIESENENRYTLPELHTWYERPSIVSESFRSTLTSLQFITSSSKQARTIAVTSPEAGSGKTTVISNLAISICEIGLRVALLDFDFHRPRLHTIFNISNVDGLSDVLQSTEDISKYTSSQLLHQTAIPGLSVMTSGTSTMNTATLVRSKRFDELLDRLRKEVDVILIDTPPSLIISDARVVAKKTDGVLIIVRSNYTARERALIAIEQLRQDGCLILGCILNHWQPKSKNHAYANGYMYESFEQA